jgi:hypothetical protein
LPIAISFYRRLLDASPIGQDGSGYQKDSLLRAMDNAHRLLSSPAAKAFDLVARAAGTHAAVFSGLRAGHAFRRAAGSLWRQV